MSHTYSRLFIHYVFITKSRYPIFAPEKRELVLNYMKGICKNYECHLESGFIMPDHVHLLINMPAKYAVAEIAKVVKANTSRFLNTLPELKCRFEWQEGYGAFTCSYSMIETINAYIRNQEEHHKQHNFQDEYRSLLLKHGLEMPSYGLDM
jgi:putative transposase